MENNQLNRRAFLAAAGAVGAASGSALLGGSIARATEPTRAAAIGQGRRGPIVIASANGMNAVTRAMEHLRQGGDPAEAVVAGVTLVEDDPNDMSVGYGGLPNADGVVQLDASVMHGPSHKGGAVAGLENIKNPAQVALQVLKRTDHVLLVGAGALAFAKAHGFKEENLLTERAREIWLRWKHNGNPNDDWLDDDQHVDKDARQAMAESLGIPYHYGTIHCAALDANGDLGACTTTSGLSYKIPGRVGDSPIIGAGMFVDNEVGAAGSTGRGESVIQSCGAFQIVQHMANGDHPTDACLKALKWIADHTKRRMLLNERGQPNFGCRFYAVRKDGEYGSATFRKGGSFAVHDGGAEARREPAAFLYE